MTIAQVNINKHSYTNSPFAIVTHFQPCLMFESKSGYKLQSKGTTFTLLQNFRSGWKWHKDKTAAKKNPLQEQKRFIVQAYEWGH